MPSPGSSFMAILPLLLMLTKSDSSLRRTSPDLLAKTTFSFSHCVSSSGKGRIVVMRSPSESGSRFTIALPRPAMRASGSRQTLSL